MSHPSAASSTPTDPGVVNYFPTVAKQANTDCGGGESVGPCAVDAATPR